MFMSWVNIAGRLVITDVGIDFQCPVLRGGF